MNNLYGGLEDSGPEYRYMVVVRLTTSAYSTERGIFLKRGLTYLKRKTTGPNHIEDEVSDIGADELFQRIINLNDCIDGVYYFEMCNKKIDWEGGYLDDWEYRLVPFKEEGND